MQTLEALDKYLRGRTLKPNSLIGTTRSMTLLSQFEQELPMSRVLINEWLTWLANTHHLVDISVWTHLNRVRAVYNYLANIYEWEKHPFKQPIHVKVANREHRIFTPLELKQIFDSLTTDTQRILCRVLLDSTCRIHEAATLQISKIENTGFTCTTSSKTGQHFYRCRPELCQAMITLANPINGYVFTRQNGQPFTPQHLKQFVRNTIIKAGIKGNKLGAHTFRHTGLTLVAGDTESAIAVQAVGGQSSIKIAMSYVHDIQKRSAQKHSPLEIAARNLNDLVSNDAQSQTALIPINPRPSTTPVKEIVINHDGTILGTGNSWLDEMFKPVPKDKIIRPVLKTQDL